MTTTWANGSTGSRVCTCFARPGKECRPDDCAMNQEESAHRAATFRDLLKPMGQKRSKPGRQWFAGCLVAARRRIVWECRDKHVTREDARNCAQSYLNCDDGSLAAEELQKACAAMPARAK